MQGKKALIYKKLKTFKLNNKEIKMKIKKVLFFLVLASVFKPFLKRNQITKKNQLHFYYHRIKLPKIIITIQ